MPACKVCATDTFFPCLLLTSKAAWSCETVGPRTNRFWPGLTEFGPPVWQAEADNVTSLSTSPAATEPGQILLENGSCQLSNFKCSLGIEITTKHGYRCVSILISALIRTFTLVTLVWRLDGRFEANKCLSVWIWAFGINFSVMIN